MSDEIPIKFKKSKDYKIFPATSTWGGVNPQGEIICHFCVEHNSFPDSLYLKTEKGKKPQEEIKENKKEITRQLQSTVVMRPDIAKSIGKWLIKQAEVVTGNDKK